MAETETPSPLVVGLVTDDNVQQGQQQDTTPSWVKVLSGSTGSIVTALLVTPLEVVKVRQQSLASSTHHTNKGRVSLCSKGCGTFVLNTGISECILPKSAVPYFDTKGPSTAAAAAATTTVPKQRTLKAVATESTITAGMGPFASIRRIFATEGLAGIYAGLAPTLVMGVPSTVLYFWTYEELTHRLSSHYQTNESGGSELPVFLPAVTGAGARLVASLATSPLELIRTRQAAAIGGGGSSPGMWQEFATIVRKEGAMRLFQGLSPTLWRDVPFSAIYWTTVEALRYQWRVRSNSLVDRTPGEQAFQAFMNGSIAGMVAAACTTPLDVVKTRQQVMGNATTAVASTNIACDHHGAIVYDSRPTASRSTASMLHHIFRTEGISGVWRGNQARMIKVAPACAIMLSSYELGKRFLTPTESTF